ncbi:DNA polymerase epsilon subunit C-like isoform X2 [Cucurbita pepo subsp. pepo]|uniref:DNA polymerase epsilon subunit C-like isoform X1 n=1 Tax=Cucurbita pepo subsp. pepo TaxID=3664 RepID=UPI000C9D8E3D|nr:DNA polymerase epsilon subunit C-like isoform X1 [Cucurbita pepo subsp. pepo]XP_023512056.1 DNA polymerase epsilon subunit C-like isoform X2 [Cucurbita pepo subsp. pepo]
MASSKKSSSEAKSKEAGTSKPAPKNKTHNNNNNNARTIDKVYSKKKKVSNNNNNNKHTSNGSVKENEVLPISAPGDAEEDRVETTSKSPNTTKSKKVKRNHGKKEENGYAEEEEEEEEAEEEEEVEEKIYKFPMNRIKKIMRDENSDLRINQEALFLVNKATEMFLVQFCKDAYACCAQDRKKSLAYKHLSSVVCKRKRYDFLSDFVPEKLKFEDALKERSMAESGKD